MLRYCWVVWSSYQDQTSSSRDYYGVSGTFSSACEHYEPASRWKPFLIALYLMLASTS